MYVWLGPRVELKLEALIGGVLQSAFNNFAKLTVKYVLKSLFNNVAGLMVCNFFKKKTLAQMFSYKFSKIFKNYFVEHVRRDAWVKWTKTIVFTKSIHRKIPVMASFLGQL